MNTCAWGLDKVRPSVVRSLTRYRRVRGQRGSNLGEDGAWTLALAAHLNVYALATGAGSPWYILVPRAGSRRYILVIRAGSPQYTSVIRLAALITYMYPGAGTYMYPGQVALGTF